ncbi:MAG: response regulator [Pseudomonadota bacterium]
MQKPTVDGQGKIILAIDDEVEILEIYRAYLSRMNFKIIACSNPNNLASILQQNNVDAVVCDYNMPNKNGIECAQIIREAKGPLFPIIMVTGCLKTKIDIPTIRKEGFNDVLEKPINFAKLAQVLNRELKRFKILRPEDFASIELQGYMTPIDPSGDIPENKKRISIVEISREAIYLEVPSALGCEGKQYVFQVICQDGSKIVNLNFLGKITCVEKLNEAYDMLTVTSQEIDQKIYNDIEKLYEEKQNKMNDFLRQARGH